MGPNLKYSPNIWAKSVLKLLEHGQQSTVGFRLTPPSFGQCPTVRRFFWMSSQGGVLRKRMWIRITMTITMMMTMSMVMMMVMTTTMMMTMTMQ